METKKNFDELYKRGLMRRREAYKWLSDQLGLPPEYTHIGMFNPETCAKVVVMRYCKGRLKIGYFTHPAKMISQNKDYIFGN